jgi:hypothetical protein
LIFSVIRSIHFVATQKLATRWHGGNRR